MAKNPIIDAQKKLYKATDGTVQDIKDARKATKAAWEQGEKEQRDQARKNPRLR
ncbi:hypothetical protein ABZ234_07855 [Nocardiopsis sp. NPDC006198]|uniref:hypothetical protein n=1 Tax=Nocardiopsis sp. NPDC006198 TaxID=3154472 RepID=UPI0033B63234